MPSQQVVPVPSGFATQGQNIQFVAIPANQLPPFTFSDFRGGGSYQRGFARGSFRGRSGRYGSGRSFTKSQGETDAYCMDVAPVTYFRKSDNPCGIT